MTDRTPPSSGAVRHLIPADHIPDDPDTSTPAAVRPETPQRLAARRRHTHQRTLLHADHGTRDEIARRVRRLRSVQKLDPVHLAIAARVPLAYVEAVETAAASTHQLSDLRRLASTLGTSVGYLLDGAPTPVEPGDHPAVVALAHIAVQTGLPTSVVLDRAARAWARIVAAADAGEHLWISTPGADLIERIQFPTRDGGRPPGTHPHTHAEPAPPAPESADSDPRHDDPDGPGDEPPLWAVSPDRSDPHPAADTEPGPAGDTTDRPPEAPHGT